MSEQHFDARLKHIEEQYQARREGADAYRDQEMARLFEESGWTQEQIAGRMGKRQVWVSQRLCFGRFLSFIASGDNPDLAVNLTERRFREHWKRSRGHERERFAAVAHALEHGIPHGHEALLVKPEVGGAVLECLADGKWYTVEQITATAEETLPGLTADQVRNSITNLRRHPPEGKRLQSKLIGKKAQYRLARALPKKSAPLEVLADLYEKATPLLDELDELGQMSMARLSPGLVRNVAFRIRRLFEALLQETTT